MPYLVKDWAAVWLPNRWLIAARGYFGPQNSHRPLMATSVNMYCTEQVGFQHWTQCILIRTKIGCRHQFPITVQCIPGLAIETEILPYRWHHMGQPRPGTKAASWRPPPGQAQTMLGILHPSSFMPGMSTSKDAVVQEPIGGAGGSGDRMWPLHRVSNPRETPNTEHKLLSFPITEPTDAADVLTSASKSAWIISMCLRKQDWYGFVLLLLFYE